MMSYNGKECARLTGSLRTIKLIIENIKNFLIFICKIEIYKNPRIPMKPANLTVSHGVPYTSITRVLVRLRLVTESRRGRLISIAGLVVRSRFLWHKWKALGP